MKKTVSVLLAMLMVFSVISVFAEGSVDLSSASAEVNGFTKSGEGFSSLNAGAYARFSSVDLSGINSVKIAVDAEPFESTSGDCIEIRTDSIEGRVIGRVVIDKDGKNSFSGAIESTDGKHDLFFISMWGHGKVDIKSITLMPDAYEKEQYIPVSDDKIIDFYSDTWTATDDIGRKVSDYEEAGAVKSGDHYVGMLYWNWNTNYNMACIPSEIVKNYPDAENNYNHNAWELNATYYWNKPLFGFYNSLDYWVYRRHAEMLSLAGVDVILFDNTNGDSTFLGALNTIYSAFHDAREAGVNTPKISFFDSWGKMDERRNQLKSYYLTFFKDGKYSDLWFNWEGKPLLFGGSNPTDMGNEWSKNPSDAELMDEIKSFFTFRGVASRDKGADEGAPYWQWLECYPQHKLGVTRSDGRCEFMSVGVAVNESYVWGPSITGVFSDQYTKGRSYTEQFGENYADGAVREGAFFKEQASLALDTDPAFVMIDGWNENTAGRFRLYSGVENAFVDNYDDEGSRDLEPSGGILGDDYYNLLVDFVRKYKGVRKAPVASGIKSIDINADVAQWDGVGPEFLNYDVSYDRDTYGHFEKGEADKKHFTTKVNNAVLKSKVSFDAGNIYFMAQAKKYIDMSTPHAMNIFINADRNSATGYMGYDYAINASSLGKISSFDSGKLVDIGEASYIVSGNTIMVSVPRSIIAETGTVDFEFKWTDGIDILSDRFSLYTDGNTAPLGSFNYLYTEKEQKTLTDAEKAAIGKTAVIKAGSGKMVKDGGIKNLSDKDRRITAFTENGTLYVPISAIEDILGYGRTQVTWDYKRAMLKIKNAGLVNREITGYTWIYTTLGSYDVRVNGYAKTLSAPITAKDGTVYVPITLFCECFGRRLYANGDTYAVSEGEVQEGAVAAASAYLGQEVK